MQNKSRKEKLNFYKTEIKKLKEKATKARDELVAMETMFVSFVKEEIGDTSKDNEQVHLADILFYWDAD